MRLIDLHCDTLAKLAKPYGRGTILENPYSVDLVRLEAADSLIQCFSTFFHSGRYPGPVREKLAFRKAQQRIDLFEKQQKYCGGRLLWIRSRGDIARCRFEHKTGALLTMEDAVPIGGRMENLTHFYERGIRLITLTWNYENAVGYPNSKNASVMEKGLKPFGLDLLAQMEELGIIADVSHLSDGGFWDVVKNSGKPFVASHSNARAVTNHPRNLTDDMIRAVAQKGGVIGLNFCPLFLGCDGVSSISHMLRHISHIYRVGGEDVLAVGTDFDGIKGTLQIPGVEKMELLLDALKKHNMTQRVIEKMWWKNALRVFEEVL